MWKEPICACLFTEYNKWLTVDNNNVVMEKITIVHYGIELFSGLHARVNGANALTYWINVWRIFM